MASPKIVFLAAGLVLGVGGIAAAHHSTAAYDDEHPQTMEGTVKAVNWTNPGLRRSWPAVASHLSPHRLPGFITSHIAIYSPKLSEDPGTGEPRSPP
jgi:hypothetical protein